MGGFWRNLKAIVCAAALGGLAACDVPSDPPLRIGLSPWPGYSFLVLAEREGYFAREGVDVKLVNLTSPADVRRAYERGQIDGMASSLLETLEVGVRSDRQPRIVFATDFSNGADVILARPSIRKVADLKGKRVAAEPGSLDVYLLARALDLAGLGLADVELVSVPQTNMAQAFARGEIDAFAAYPPRSVDLLNGGTVRKIFDSSMIPGEIVDVLVFDAETLQRRRASVASVVRAWDRAVKQAAEDPNKSLGIMAGWLGMETEDLRRLLGQIEILRSRDQEEILADDGSITRSLALSKRILQDLSGREIALVQPLVDPTLLGERAIQ